MKCRLSSVCSVMFFCEMPIVFCVLRNVLLLNADCLLCVQECSSVECRLSSVCSGMFFCEMPIVFCVFRNVLL